MTTIDEQGEVLDTPQLHLSYRHRDDRTVVVTASGQIDVESATELRTVLVDLIEQGCAKLVMNMADVSFIDSSGLGALIAAHKKADAQGSSLRLVAVAPEPSKVLRITGLDQVFPSWETEEAAIAAETTPDS